jgi:hypothetical protein
LQAEQFKQKVEEILGNEIRFDGHVEQVVENISEDKQRSILDWIKDCQEGLNRPEPCKNYPHLISFIYKSNDNRIRGLLTKEKNSYFIELFLDKHKYYDRKRRYLGI